MKLIFHICNRGFYIKSNTDTYEIGNINLDGINIPLYLH